MEFTHLEKRIVTDHHLFKLWTNSLSEHSLNNIQPVFIY